MKGLILGGRGVLTVYMMRGGDIFFGVENNYLHPLFFGVKICHIFS